MASKFLERNFASMNKKEEETAFQKALKKINSSKQNNTVMPGNTKGVMSDKEFSIFKKLLEEE